MSWALLYSLSNCPTIDTPQFINPIVAKLPHDLIDRWKNEAYKHKESHHGLFPPFPELAIFLRRSAKIRNDVSLMVRGKPQDSGYQRSRPPLKTVQVNNTNLYSHSSGVRQDTEGIRSA